MRLVFITFGGNLYGANLSMIDLIVGLRGKGVDSCIIYPEQGTLEQRLKELGIRGIWQPFSNCVHWPSDKPVWHPRRWASMSANMLRSIQKRRVNRSRLEDLVQVAREFGASAIVSNTSTVDIGLSVARHLAVPHVWHIREFGDLDWDFHPDFGFAARRACMQASAQVVFISKAVANHHLAQCRLRKNTKFKVVYNPIASAEVLSRRAASAVKKTVDTMPFVFGLAGYVKHSKGQFEAASALKLLLRRGFDTRLVVAGTGATAELENQCRNLGIFDRVDILGHLSGPQMDEFYQGIDCGLMCSSSEGFGRTTVEYMSWGKPAIGRNSGATPELVRHGENGLLYEHSVDALARAMEAMIADPAGCRAMGLAATKFAAAFSNERVASDFLAALN